MVRPVAARFITCSGWPRLSAARNTARLRVRGAIEFGQSHYPKMVDVPRGWLGGLWWFGFDRPVQPGFLAFSSCCRVAYLVSRAGSALDTASSFCAARLGSTRAVPWLRHPNYVVVAMEIAIVPLASDCPVRRLFSVLPHSYAAPEP